MRARGVGSQPRDRGRASSVRGEGWEGKRSDVESRGLPPSHPASGLKRLARLRGWRPGSEPGFSLREFDNPSGAMAEVNGLSALALVNVVFDVLVDPSVASPRP